MHALGRLPAAPGVVPPQAWQRLLLRLRRPARLLRDPAARRVLPALLLVQAGQLLVGVIIYSAVGLDLSMPDLTLVAGGVHLAGVASLTPSGLGVKELVSALLLRGAVPAEQAVTASLLVTAVMQGLPAVGGLALLPGALREVR